MVVAGTVSVLERWGQISVKRVDRPIAPSRFALTGHKSGNLVSHYPGHSLGYMDELKHPQFEDFVITKLSDMKDPSLNKIEDPVFGADVEKVAKIGPPRLPKIPEGNEELAAKIAAMTVN